MIAVAITGVLLVSMMVMMDNASRMGRTGEMYLDLQQVTGEMMWLLEDQARCTAALGGRNASNTPSGTINRLIFIDPASTQVNRFPTVALDPAQSLGSTRLQVLYYRLSDASSDTNVATNTTELLVGFNSLAPVYGGQRERSIRLWVQVDGATNITACRAIGSGQDSLWRRSPSVANGIYYGAGAVAVGADAPVGTFSVWSVTPSTTPPPYRGGIIAESEGDTHGARIAGIIYSDTEAPHFSGFRASGTKAAPLPVPSGKSLVNLAGFGFHGGGWSGNSGSPKILLEATEDWAAGAWGSRIALWVTPNGQTSNYEAVVVQNDGDLRIADKAGTSCLIGVGTGGTACTSDERLKQNIQRVPDAFARLSQIDGVEFEWNEKTAKAGMPAMGLIAQQVGRVFPLAVQTDTKTGHKMVNYSALVAPLIESVKEVDRDWKLEASRLRQDLERLKAEFAGYRKQKAK